MDIIALIGAVGAVVGLVSSVIVLWSKMTSRINEVNRKQQEWIDTWPDKCATHRRELFDKMDKYNDKAVDAKAFAEYKSGVDNRLNKLENN